MAPAKNRNETTPATAPSDRNVHVEFDEGIAWVTMNRPDKRNAMNPALNDEMLQVLDGLEVDDACGGVVLTGPGDPFSPGMDLTQYLPDLPHLPSPTQLTN